MVLAAYKAGGRQIKKKRLRPLPAPDGRGGLAIFFYWLPLFANGYAVLRLAVGSTSARFIFARAQFAPYFVGAQYCGGSCCTYYFARLRGAGGAPPFSPLPPPRARRLWSVARSSLRSRAVSAGRSV